ncbi:MAG: efflux RND transporter permease subunit [Myxococcota bacterium]
MTPTPQQQSGGLWGALIGWFIENRLIVFLLILLLIGGGLFVSPFQVNLGSLPRDPVPVDAIPDIGENQQIVFTEWAGRSPRDVEDQITYPLTTALLGIPGVRTVRSSSALGFSTIYVIFDDNVEFYWSRSRVLEKLSSLAPGTVPDDATPTLGPDATALGQVFWYTLQGQDPDGNVVGGWDPDELRSAQDWTVRYALQSVAGVSEVASIGGFVREYQVDVDPEAMRANGVTITQIADAVRRSNLDVGARTLEINGVEYLVRGLGFIEEVGDLEQTVVVARQNTPVRVADVARVTLGPALRRGALDDAGAPAVGGVVVARYLENPRSVIDAVKARIAEIQPGLPRRTLEDGTVSQITIEPFYDRSTLIDETLSTLSTALYQQILITIIVVLVMLRNLRSSMLISMILPLGVLGTFIIMKLTGVDANVMALGGIAIAIGTMVDISIVFVENIDQHLEQVSSVATSVRERAAIVRPAAAEVAPAVFTSVATTIVSFLPVLGLTASEYRLFAPLALTKTFAMGGALVLALVVLPGAALIVLRRRPAAVEGDGNARVLRSVFRWTHLRDWALILLGLGLLPYAVMGGLLVASLGVWRLVRPLLPAGAARVGTSVENVVTIVVVAALLVIDWSPLGHGAGFFVNFLFAGTLIAIVLGGFRAFESVYTVILRWILAHKIVFLLAPAALLVFGLLAWRGFDKVVPFLPQVVRTSAPVAAVAHAFPGLGREYMPPFDEGSYLYMPTTMPHASIGGALDMLSTMDAAIAQIPEVDRVVGKLGRADSALDPAPISMIETVITYVPEYKTLDDGSRVRQWRDHIRSPRDIWTEITQAAEVPGLTGAPTLMPINARIVMLQSGMRAPMGIKVKGPTLDAIEGFGRQLESALKQVSSVRAETVFADRVVGKPYLEIDLDREAIGRYGLRILDVQQALQVALGGMTLTRTVEGRERYPVRVRYAREDRDSIEALRQVFVPAANGEPIPLTQVADIRYVRGPQVIKAEDTFLTSYVLFDRDPEVAEVEVVEQAKEYIEQQIANGNLEIPAGVSYNFAGSYANQIRSEQRMLLLIPIALIFVFILLYLQFHRVMTTAIIYSGVLVSVSGGFLLLWLYGQPWFLNVTVLGAPLREIFQVGTVNVSMAVWIGVIALIGIATDDGVVMATYLKQVFERSPADTVEAVRANTLEAGLRRVRPCLMTTATTLLALLPVITSQGRGADMMVPLALPVAGGMLIELMTLFLVPVLYSAVEEWRLPSRSASTAATGADGQPS